LKLTKRGGIKMGREYIPTKTHVYSIDLEEGYNGKLFLSVDRQTKNGWRQSLVGFNVIFEAEYEDAIFERIMTDLKQTELGNLAESLSDWIKRFLNIYDEEKLIKRGGIKNV
jgi:hypothetical protein